MKKINYVLRRSQRVGFTDAGDGITCMDCGRERESCYCGIPTWDERGVK